MCDNIKHQFGFIAHIHKRAHALKKITFYYINMDISVASNQKKTRSHTHTRSIPISINTFHLQFEYASIAQIYYKIKHYFR